MYEWEERVRLEEYTARFRKKEGQILGKKKAVSVFLGR
jgi:hypothetical protein